MIKLVTWFFLVGMVRIFTLAMTHQSAIELIFVTLPLLILFALACFVWLEYLDEG